MRKWFSFLGGLPGWTSSLVARMAWMFLFLISFMAVFGPWLANEKPYYCKLDSEKYFPAFSTVSESVLSAAHPNHSPVSWKTTPFQSVWRAPIPYSHHTIDLKTGAYLSPFDAQADQKRFRHWLGTDQLGRDVMAGMIRGCRVSLLIGLGSMLIALLIGIPLGAAGAYWGNQGWRISSWQLVCMILFVAFIFLLWFAPIAIVFKVGLTLIGFLMIILAIKNIPTKRRGRWRVPLDQMVMSSISIIDGFPGIFLILIMVAIVPVKGWLVVMGAIGLLRWPSMARYMRAEVFKMRETNYIKAAQILNIPPIRILRKHIIPYAFRPVMISFIFGVSSAILAESSLSFLGIGLPTEEINWGRLLAQSRNHFDAWWLVVFPGCAIFFTLLSLYTIGGVWQKEQTNPPSLQKRATSDEAKSE